MVDDAKESPTGSDKVAPAADQQVEDDALTAFMNEVWDNMAKLGIGAHAELQFDGPSLPAIEILKGAPTDATAPAPVAAPIDLPPPPTRIQTDDVTMDIYPDVDPGKKEVTINVKGEF